jgi:hypothetical protein
LARSRGWSRGSWRAWRALEDELELVEDDELELVEDDELDLML